MMELKNSFLNNYKIRLYLKREDLVHPVISGNKFRKLKYNIVEAKKKEVQSILSFGGAYSNHIEALSYAGKLHGFKTIGIIRGEELAVKDRNETLKQCEANGMKLLFVDRASYRLKEKSLTVKNYLKEHKNILVLPEGGTNDLAVKGCEEILTENDKKNDYVCCAVGTGGTITGLINSKGKEQRIIGFNALNNVNVIHEINQKTKNNQWNISEDYNFGGYGKITEELVVFMNDFRRENNVVLDPIYTGKMMFGIYDLIKKGRFKKNTSILAIHTGGLQGIDGMNTYLRKKGLPEIIT